MMSSVTLLIQLIINMIYCTFSELLKFAIMLFPDEKVASQAANEPPEKFLERLKSRLRERGVTFTVDLTYSLPTKVIFDDPSLECLFMLAKPSF